MHRHETNCPSAGITVCTLSLFLVFVLIGSLPFGKFPRSPPLGILRV
jgi:hypothetical protein